LEVEQHLETSEAKCYVAGRWNSGSENNLLHRPIQFILTCFLCAVSSVSGKANYAPERFDLEHLPLPLSARWSFPFQPDWRRTDVTIYYRPPSERPLDVWDWGHIFIYVRDDQTGQAAYFDYYPENGYSVLGQVDQARIDAHASLTIETDAEQEQSILAGIREMQQRLPDWKLKVVMALFGRSSTCVSRSQELLKRGRIIVKGTGPRGVWENVWRQYSDEFLTWKQNQISAAKSGKRAEKYRPGSGFAEPEPGREYGRDPQHQSRRANPQALNNLPMFFKDGQRVK